MSRSRSRLSMDWRPASRSRSRPPLSAPPGSDQQQGIPISSHHDGRYPFPAIVSSNGVFSRDQPIKSQARPDTLSSGDSSLKSSSIPIPGTSSVSGGRRSPAYPYPSRSDLSSLYESDNRLNTNFDSLSTLANYASGQMSTLDSLSLASSLPAFGYYGLAGPPSVNRPPPPEHRAFPRYVRKTSFDHTVSKDGIFVGVSGRHQVNGKPLSPNSLVGTKRPADAPHAESMLRGDPPIVDRSAHMMGRDHEQFERSSPFPASAFNFSFPPYDNFFDPSGSVSGIGRSEFGPSLHNSDDNHSNEGHYHSSAASSAPRSSFQGPQNVKSGLSAAAAEASVVMAESYAQLDATNLAGMDESRLDYQLMNFYSSGNVAQHPFTHVDPAQTFSIEQDTGAYPSFQASPSSDGWGNGASATTSPEPITSSASTPPSAEGVPSGQQNARPTAGHSNRNGTTSKFVPMKQGSQDTKKKALSVRISGEVRSGASTPDPPESGVTSTTNAKGPNEDGDTPTHCTNCQTTNTPLWRRDPEGHPLCTWHHGGDTFLYG